uniref:Thylakoid membrane protein slr0575 family n=1 Tax=Cajanus cajan TaxID=3821 RepID=A0A151S154_CAJCA|nr:Thylakoid membrane protein slr0575 family [Cajanus cajan]
MPGGATVCSGHRFLCVLPHSTRPRLTLPTRSRPVPVQLGSISISTSLTNGGSNRFGSKLSLIPRAADSSSAQPSLVPDDDFSISKVSFGVIGLGVGLSLLSYGFGAYFNLFPGSEWSAIMLTYGFPLAIIGMALKYAELKPVLCLTYSDAQSLREKCATPILKQVKSDVTRYRYGDEQHLDEALKRIFQYGQGGGIPRRSAPVLQMIREEVTEDGKYCLVLVFEAKDLQLSDFEKRQAKFASFFGPGITAEVGESDVWVFGKSLILNNWKTQNVYEMIECILT